MWLDTGMTATATAIDLGNLLASTLDGTAVWTQLNGTPTIEWQGHRLYAGDQLAMRLAGGGMRSIFGSVASSICRAATNQVCRNETVAWAAWQASLPVDQRAILDGIGIDE